jgi:hypothetical protein
VWNACVLMARYVYQQLGDSGELQGCRVLVTPLFESRHVAVRFALTFSLLLDNVLEHQELGAGLGIVGIAAAQKGADVMMVPTPRAVNT